MFPEDKKLISDHISDAITFSRLGKFGRTGNQMFQYALLLAVAARNGFTIEIPNGPLNCFNLTCSRSPRQNLKSRKNVYRVKPAFKYDQGVFDQPAGTDFAGYFQSYLYFDQIQELIRSEFCFVPQIDLKATEFITSLRRKHKNALVFVSARRGDYLKYRHIHNPFTTRYFKEAKSYFVPDSMYVVTSDDMKWARENLNWDDVIFVPETDHAVCMAIGTKCDHHLCSAGTYSWWAAWLCQSIGKTIVIPSPWYNSSSSLREDKNQMSPPGWIRHKFVVQDDDI